MTYQLIQGNALHLPLEDDSVDLVVSSPPYFALRAYQDGGEVYDGQIGSEATPQAFLEALWAWTAECRRVLKPSGSMFVNLGDKYSGSNGQSGGASQLTGATYDPSGGRSKGAKRGGYVPKSDIPAKSLMMLPQRYAIGCIDQLGLILRAEIIWSKPNGLPESVTDRVRRSHEQWFHMTKEPRYFSAVDEVREGYADNRSVPGVGVYGEVPTSRYDRQDIARNGFNTVSEKHVNGTVSGMTGNPLGKLPGSVWTIPTEPLRVPDHIGVDHFAAFPSEWPRRLILGWSPSGVCVACGEGRRPVVAKEWEEPSAKERARLDRIQRERVAVDGGDLSSLGRRDVQATITGYACACPTTTAPTRPAVILDPFSGTGTTAAVAHILGRHGIGIDLSADYLRLAEWRCNDPALRAKVLRVDKPKAVPDGQLDIFGGAA